MEGEGPVQDGIRRCEDGDVAALLMRPAGAAFGQSEAGREGASDVRAVDGDGAIGRGAEVGEDPVVGEENVMDGDGKDLTGRIPTVVDAHQGVRRGEQTEGQHFDERLVRRTWPGQVNEDGSRAGRSVVGNAAEGQICVVLTFSPVRSFTADRRRNSSSRCPLGALVIVSHMIRHKQSCLGRASLGEIRVGKAARDGGRDHQEEEKKTLTLP